MTEGPLPTEVLAAIDDAALKAQPEMATLFLGGLGFGPGALGLHASTISIP